MPLYVLLPMLIAISYVAVNLGSKHKVSLAKIALTLAVMCVIVYFASPLLAPLVNLLMQLGTHVRLR
jgi:hypothetical protein